ncbi:uncharacterized protein LOC6647760 isoform X1 [Drosophila willistoni]|uniref:uncharacterized protein LOC6647760 isoform X1 n=1 Tax=Drosophila willistoni TaxID=7260 RepID=UPI000C26D375|nr:uncharacterized protein LOC6647760 isoform X1 [Drosophila willistoni]
MVNVPPLLSSTPPPIDFGDDDDDDSGLQTTLHLDDGDEYSSNEFGLVTTNKHITSNNNNNNNNNNSQTHEAELNTKEVPPPDLALIENAKSPVEAFNYHVYHQEMSPPTPPPPTATQQTVQCVEVEREEEEEEEHIPSLKLDSLSLYSSESTASGTASPVAETPAPSSATTAQLTHQVTLEDVSDDDTDEECSPKKPKELYIREGAEDFFAIEVLSTTKEKETKQTDVKGAESQSEKPMAMDDDDSFAEFEEATAAMAPAVIQNVAPTINDNVVVDDDDDDDDFGDFADFSAAPPAPMPAIVAPVTIPNVSEPAHTQPEDGFDDFQEFTSPAHIKNNHDDNDDDDDDDDFGDFSEPPPPLAAVVPPPPPPAPKHLSINERIKPVLEAMFPSTAITQIDETVGHSQLLAQRKPLNFGAIEQAQALNYQWVNSEMRHSLVRSLGIDSRNILFGDKWNSSMPRFAANLSFDPLKPLKTSSTSSNSQTSAATTFSTPVEESQHVQTTFQLEPLDQLTMVANADKINLVNSNYPHHQHYNNYHHQHHHHHNQQQQQQQSNSNHRHNAADNFHLDGNLLLMDLQTNSNSINDNQCNANANANANFNEMHNKSLTHFVTNNNNNHLNTTTSNPNRIKTNTILTAHDALLLMDLRLESTTTTAAPAAKASQIETRAGPANVEKSAASSAQNDCSQLQIEDGFAANSPCDSNALDDTSAGTSAYAAPAAAATLSTALSANGYANDLNGSEQLHQQQQSKQYALSGPTPSPPPPLPQEDIEIIVSNTTSTSTSYALPLKETHIYTPSKSDTAVAKTTTLAPIDFDFEIASAGIIIDETVVKKEYRDVEYKPPIGLDSPNKLNAGVNFEIPPVAVAAAAADQKVPDDDNDDFSEFQSMPAPKASAAAAALPRNGTPTFGEQMILSPAILLPQAIPLAKTAIQWGENALSTINADEMARIEQLFSAQAAKPAPTISATVAKNPPKQQQSEDDEWSDFVSAPVQQEQKQKQLSPIKNIKSVNSLKKPSPTPATTVAKDDDWSDFVSSTPAHPVTVVPSPQFNSGAWQNANFYNNPLSHYQQQQPHHTHSNLVRNSNRSISSNTTTTNNNNNNIKNNSNYNANNNVSGTPQQIHIMHDFSTAPSAQPVHPSIPTYQQQHQRQQFQIGNAKVAPRISLIPDLSFVAPPSAMPTTNAGAFMSALPKPSFSAKK